MEDSRTDEAVSKVRSRADPFTIPDGEGDSEVSELVLVLVLVLPALWMPHLLLVLLLEVLLGRCGLTATRLLRLRPRCGDARARGDGDGDGDADDGSDDGSDDGKLVPIPRTPLPLVLALP